MNRPDSEPSLRLRGAHAVAELFFLAVEPPDPLGDFPALCLQERQYNLWLTDEILRPTLARWSPAGTPERPDPEAVRGAFAAASDAARAAFAQVLPAASAAGEPAVLAAMGVTANLQRTLALLAEFVLEEHPPAAPARPRAQRRDPRHLTNALWCSAEEVKARCAEALDRLRREIRQDRGLSGE